MNHGTYYNEIDPFAAQWLRNLITAGAIAAGDVDERSIEDVRPDDLLGYTQCHFFAGIGGWSLALRLAGWPDDQPVWTGSCPCQPFSAAGKGAGFADERHLWPAFHYLIRVFRPGVVFGEQVASKDGLAWLDLVADDVEGEGYTIGAVDSCAAGFGAPQIRQRLYWVASAMRPGRAEGRPSTGDRQIAGSGDLGGLAGTDLEGSGGRRVRGPSEGDRASAGATRERPAGLCATGGLARTSVPGCAEQCGGRVEHAGIAPDGEPMRPGPTNGYWGDADWLLCRDAKWRPVESGTFPLAHGISGRVGQLRGYGNAIVPPQAADFIRAYQDAIAET